MAHIAHFPHHHSCRCHHHRCGHAPPGKLQQSRSLQRTWFGPSNLSRISSSLHPFTENHCQSLTRLNILTLRDLNGAPALGPPSFRLGDPPAKRPSAVLRRLRRPDIHLQPDLPNNLYLLPDATANPRLNTSGFRVRAEHFCCGYRHGEYYAQECNAGDVLGGGCGEGVGASRCCLGAADAI